jgi:hypothetical protein
VILEVDAGHLVERDHVPQTHQADLAGRHVVEQVGHRGLTTDTRMLFGLISL